MNESSHYTPPEDTAQPPAPEYKERKAWLEVTNITGSGRIPYLLNLDQVESIRPNGNYAEITTSSGASLIAAKDYKDLKAALNLFRDIF